jgi:UV DNA damage repair endonuclease
MFNQNIKRIGFACKIQISESKADPKLNQSGTTIKWLSSQTPDRARERLWDLMRANVTALANQIEWVGKQPPMQRMFRITSDLLTAYSHDDWMPFYFQPDVVAFLESNLSKIGERARKLDIKLSFHPGQFCVLASEQDHVVENSIVEFEYHCDLIRYMGYGREFQDFKCNVHIGGKRGPDGIKAALRRLSPEARNCLTIENAEFTWGLDSSLELEHDCALVLDIHHHWINSGGQYIEPSDDRFKRVVDSWRGVRPTIHYSVSREDVVGDHDTHTSLHLPTLKASGFTNAKLRAHSEYYWNQVSNDWALTFLPVADIMCESKQKNIASKALVDYYESKLK